MDLLWVRFHLVIKNWAFYHEGLSKCQLRLSLIFADSAMIETWSVCLYIHYALSVPIPMQVVLLLARLYTMLSHFRYPFT